MSAADGGAAGEFIESSRLHSAVSAIDGCE